METTPTMRRLTRATTVGYHSFAHRHSGDIANHHPSGRLQQPLFLQVLAPAELVEDGVVPTMFASRVQVRASIWSDLSLAMKE
jgi:hypothetical protein